MIVNLCVDFATGRFGDREVTSARAWLEARGLELIGSDGADDRLAAWIDWQFAPSWWSAEVRQGRVWYAQDRQGEICGFVAFDVPGRSYPWLRAYGARPEVGVFGPFGVAAQHRGTGLGTALLALAMHALRAAGYAFALIAAVGPTRLIEMYKRCAGALVVDCYDLAPERRFRTVLLASGNGTNAQYVLDEVASGRLAIEPVALVANTARARAIERAQSAGVDAKVVVWERGVETRDVYDARLIETVEALAPELVLLLGWMHRLPPAFIDRFAAILNVHPAFLPVDPRADEVIMPDGSSIPALRGAHAVRDALAAQLRWSGVSVHHVTAQIDRGEVAVRTPIPIGTMRTVEELADRLRPVEHAAVGAAIRRWTFERI